jgi:hypothetical protein
MDLTSLTPTQLRRAADLQERIEALKTQLAEILGAEKAPQPAPPAATGSGKKRRMSPQGRARIAAAARERWAKYHSQSPSPAAAPKKKRKLSPAGRAAIIAATKARWAREKAGKAR